MTDHIKESLIVLKSGKTILYPTDTLWGLGCDATNPKAVSEIYKLKNRIETKALICLVCSIGMLKTYIKEIPEAALGFLKTATKPTTIIYNNPRLIATNLVAQDNTLAIRIVEEGFAYELIKAFNKPLVSTSANISGNSAPKSFKEIHADILKDVDYVVNLQDEKTDAEPSTIIKILEDGTVKIIRP
ncbi:threonylcarbamoyl-AMP synthase [Bizionia argentinensis JUB59]|uniref:L-threonylcarbamoyladenylate synthase n=1 Tax=Bizionia argentinensis JUB59 TaxID=1046627 RepID=G2EF48_9FLAO|nr:L-threonylcarbamoyladenylate synthase [Bizionia argentinensis]EGV42960.1 threonylcarbamoyl-AMP synthase [Bizionia argentinensis JUB59]